MPLASMLEMNKPFVFASSHSDETSSDHLASTTNNKTSLPRPPSMDHTITANTTTTTSTTTTTTKLPPASPLDRGLYYSSSSSIPSDHHHHDTHLEHAPHPSTIGDTNGYQDQQAPPLPAPPTSRLNGYHYPTTKSITGENDMSSFPSSSSTSTSTTLNSQLLSSPSTPTTAPPPLSSSTNSQKSSSFGSHLPTTHLQKQDDSSLSISLPPPSSLTHNNHEVNSIDHHHQHHHHHHHHHHHPVSTENTITMPTLPPPSAIAAAATLSTTAPSILAPPPPPPLPPADMITISNVTTTTAPPPQPSISRRPAGQGDEGDSGYFDSSAPDNRRMKRRKELNQRIDVLNHDFLINKERIFAEKLLVVQNEVGQAHNNTHIQYKEGLILLESIRQKTIQDGRLLRDYQTQVTDNQFMLEIHRAEEEYLAEKHEVREKLFAVLEEKRRKLKEDKDNCDLAYDVVLESQTRMNKRNLRKRGMENGDGKLNKRKQVSGPALVFRLKDEEVFDDLQAMRNGLSTQTKKSSTSKKK